MLPVLHIPDPALRSLCAPVTGFDAGLRMLAGQMLETMYAAPGRGLAAPQVGRLMRLFVMDATWKTGTPNPIFFVNPVILAQSDRIQVAEEACLSIPGRTVRIARPAALTLRWQGLAGETQEAAFDGFAATCIQHERDHLDGILCIDYPLVAA